VLAAPRPRISYDLYICHATEDKVAFVRPLVAELQKQGVRVWYDEQTMTVGDSLRLSIDQGLAQCRYGAVVLSKEFFNKRWTTNELNGLVAREEDTSKRILPVWHGVDGEYVRQFSPILADRLAVSSDLGIGHVVAELLRAMRADIALPRPRGVADTPKVISIQELRRTMANPKYDADLSALRTSANITPIISSETIFIVVGTTSLSDLFDRSLAEVLRARVDRKGANAFRRAIVINDAAWYNERNLLGSNPVIAVGGPPSNHLTRYLDSLEPENPVYDVNETIDGNIDLRHIFRKPTIGGPQAAVWGTTAHTTKTAIEWYISTTNTKGLQRFLDVAWR
jgi:hypothetical protein